MSRTENIAVFEDTRRRCLTDPELKKWIQGSNHMQELILEREKIKKPAARFDRPARVIVSNKRSLEAAEQYLIYDTCVLNFASATNPGGGVVTGSSAQEESLCRCTTLYESLTARQLWKPFYEAHRRQNNPLHNDDCIYTPDVVVIKTDTQVPEPLEQEDWWWVNVITCAAPNLRPDHNEDMRVQIGDNELFELHVKRMRRILNIAAINENKAVILGAFGCGAFQNSPEVVASAMKKVVEEYRYHFRVIEFAVYCPPGDDWNYQTFLRIINGKPLQGI